jgi:hypothetical protein
MTKIPDIIIISLGKDAESAANKLRLWVHMHGKWRETKKWEKLSNADDKTYQTLKDNLVELLKGRAYRKLERFVSLHPTVCTYVCMD